METLWSKRYAARASRMRSSAVRELLKLSQKPDVISFAGGLPASEAFPSEHLKAAVDRVMNQNGAQALQYGTTEGLVELREMIARHTRRYGIVISAENVLITTGSQQALDLIGKLFLDPGDPVLVERPTYLGALQAWNAYQADYVSVPVDRDGMRIGELEVALRSKPKFIYALPNFQNPTGVTLSLERRRRLIELADRHGVPIVEDDPYGQLRYEGDHLPSLVALDATARNKDSYSGNVIYLSTFSKIIAPGLRLGWIVAPKRVIENLVLAKQGADLHTSTFVQMVVYELARRGFLDRHIRKIRGMYKARRDAMVDALRAHVPPRVNWIHPEGGLFVWLTLPGHLDATEVLQLALLEKVAFVPGASFYAGDPERSTLRLNFSSASPERIAEGIRRLGRVIDRMLTAATREPSTRESPVGVR